MHYIDVKVESSNRYNIRKFCKFEEGLYDDMTSYFLEELSKLPSAGSYEITNIEARPDVYSRDIYGTDKYWQLLLRYNNIASLHQLSLGTILYYPSITALETPYFSLKSKAGNQ